MKKNLFYFMSNIPKKVKEEGFNDTFKAVKSRAVKISQSILLRLKLKKLLRNYGVKFAQHLDIKEIRQGTLNYIESMRIKDSSYGLYKYSESQLKPVLYSSCYAALIRHLYKDLQNLTKKQRKEWIDYIQSFQTDNGLFEDPAVKNEIAANSDWWGWRHLTLHAFMALTTLGSIVKKKFKIIEPFKDIDFVVSWLESRDWIDDPATTSNEIQNYFTMLQYARDFQGESWADRSMEVAFNWLGENQDKNTGLWGNCFDTPMLLSYGVQTGYHIWLLYFWDKRPIRYIEKIIDNCLSTQNELGGFGVQINSSACEDIDSIDPLVRFSFINDHKNKDIYSRLQKSIPWILTNMNNDGGFVFRRMESFVYGHQLMSSRKDESAMFPTWFRTLSLAYIGKCLPDSSLGKFDWQFIRCPGLQFWYD